MTTSRHPDWQTLLDVYVAKHERLKFDWQNNNCTTFASDWITEATGRVMEVPATETARKALRELASLSGLKAEACRQMGEPLMGTFAQCGDVVLLRMPRSRNRTSYAMGICLGPVCAAPGHESLLMVPITEAEAAWRV
jgi:hypothetical protein